LAQTAVTRLVAAAADPETQQAAIQALTVVRDAQPSSQAYLPEQLTPLIRRRVWAVRWQRNRPQILANILQSIQWGYLAAALTLGPLYGIGGLGGVESWALRIAVLFYSLAIAGFIGGAAAGLGALVSSVLRSLPDRVHPWRDWALAGLATAAAVAFGQVLLLAAAPGSVWRTGSMFGLVLAASLATVGGVVAAARLLAGRWPIQLAAAMLVGAGAFGLAAWLGRLSTGVWPMALGVAALSGASIGVIGLAGLFPGFWRPEPPQASDESQAGPAGSTATRHESPSAQLGGGQ
jgi:MFS family permease